MNTAQTSLLWCTVTVMFLLGKAFYMEPAAGIQQKGKSEEPRADAHTEALRRRVVVAAPPLTAAPLPAPAPAPAPTKGREEGQLEKRRRTGGGGGSPTRRHSSCSSSDSSRSSAPSGRFRVGGRGRSRSSTPSLSPHRRGGGRRAAS